MKVNLCGAKTRQGNKCKAPAMKNGRCKLHGGKSTGAKTKEGLERISKANFKHGMYTKENLQTKKMINKSIKDANELIKIFKY